MTRPGAGVAAGVLCAMLLVAGCGTGESEPASTSATASGTASEPVTGDSPSPDPETSSPEPTADPTTDPATDDPGEPSEPTGEPTDGAAGPDTTDPTALAAVDDLADRLDIDDAVIGVGVIESVTWPDGAAGCPQPGKVYTQALVDGSRLILTVDGDRYVYVAGEDESLRYCADPAQPVSVAESM